MSSNTNTVSTAINALRRIKYLKAKELRKRHPDWSEKKIQEKAGDLRFVHYIDYGRLEDAQICLSPRIGWSGPGIIGEVVVSVQFDDLD